MTAHRRAGDTEDHEHERAGNGIDIYGPKGMGLAATGPNGLLVAISVVVLLVGIGGMAWIQSRGHAELVRLMDLDRQDHRDIKLSEDRMSCILTLNQEDRERFRRNWHPGIAASFCPWVEAR